MPFATLSYIVCSTNFNAIFFYTKVYFLGTFTFTNIYPVYPTT